MSVMLLEGKRALVPAGTDRTAVARRFASEGPDTSISGKVFRGRQCASMSRLWKGMALQAVIDETLF